MGTYKTSLCMSVSSNNEFEVELEIEYKVHPGFAGDRTDPPEPASAEITEAYVIEGKKRVATPAWLFNRLSEDEDLMTSLLADHADAHIAAEDDRADAIRKERMLLEIY